MNRSIVIASLRLGKTSVDAIKNLSKYKSGILEPFSISVVCTQVPQELCEGVYVIIWLGSDNSKGIPTEWKQGYKAFGRVKSIMMNPLLLLIFYMHLGSQSIGWIF